MNCWHIYCSNFAGGLKGVKRKEMLLWLCSSCFAEDIWWKVGFPSGKFFSAHAAHMQCVPGSSWAEKNARLVGEVGGKKGNLQYSFSSSDFLLRLLFNIPPKCFSAGQLQGCNSIDKIHDFSPAYEINFRITGDCQPLWCRVLWGWGEIFCGEGLFFWEWL